MCGICGLARLDGAPLEPPGDLLDRMTDALAHRGPDDRGTWVGETVALGARRLAVIDLSAAGHQPMVSEDGTVVLVHNGEVYNYREVESSHRLRDGHAFRSRTDTEVLLHLYEELGMDMVPELDGMFAFAVWDRREHELHLVRDRFGIKPLFWQRDGTHLRFASEIKSILADSRVPRKVSPQALSDYLALGYVPGPHTMFRGIHELPPGHWMRVRADGSIEVRRWWDLPFAEDDAIGGRAAAGRALELMDQAVRRQLLSDVPLGVLLSGGLDSSAVAALVRRHSQEPIRTFTVGFEDPSFDEREAARAVAAHLGAVHKDVLVTPGLVRDMLPAYVRCIDEPYADGSAIPTWYVSALAREDVTVLLSGEGGDEAFAGYDTHAAFKVAGLARFLPRALRRAIVAPLVELLPVSHEKLSLEFRMKRFLGGLDLDPVDAHLWWRVVLPAARRRALLASSVIEAAAEPAERWFREVWRRSPARDALNRILHVDAAVFLPDDLMVKNDRMTMAHSLEARVPFTDSDLIGFMATVPARVKLPGLEKKRVMREALRGLLPPHVLTRKKIGLEMPYSRWLAADLEDVLLDWCGPERVRSVGLFRPEAVAALVGEHRERRFDHGRPLWALMSFMMWHEAYLG